MKLDVVKAESLGVARVVQGTKPDVVITESPGVAWVAQVGWEPSGKGQ